MPALQADAAIDRYRLREELARRTGELQALETYTPLPPQPWGWVATDHFWSRALLTPIALLFWGPLFLIIFPLTLHLDVVWWQSALGFYLYYRLWGGLVERLARKRLARRYRRTLIAGAGMESSSTEEVPSPAARWGGPEEYDKFMRRVFGRYDRLVHHVFNLGFLLFVCYPGWWTKAVGALWLLGLGRFVRASIRRHRLNPPVDPVLPAAPTGALDRVGPPKFPGSG
ncbi:hypothetical protein [Nannocystis pusilla]|uniref:Glycosyl-4,4'-diaponeurosporenoate acyltransferase n=1 Tax=Nannocystis pusilla TaxID=889268 RepID=A0ABS7TR00_9BACT|nr:hypothetical protein [Nannocystis pusilla]MBZ5710667.1 hypothetical protein [Nannocystis pusilla]